MDGLKQEKRSILDLLPFGDDQVETLENCGDCSTCPLDGSSDDDSDFGCYRFAEIPSNFDCTRTRAEALRINQRVVELIESTGESMFADIASLTKQRDDQISDICKMRHEIATLKAQQQQPQLDTREQAAEKCVSLLRTLVMMGDRVEVEWLHDRIEVLEDRGDKLHKFPFE